MTGLCPVPHMAHIAHHGDADERLRILALVHVPWDRNLGGARVQLELAEEWRRMGHVVDKFDFDDAFPSPAPSYVMSLLRPSFSTRAGKFARRVARDYDIIDAHQYNLPFDKRSLGFNGLLVARSVGLFPMYDEFTAFARQKWPEETKGSAIGDWLRRRVHRRDHPSFLRSLQVADLINVGNEDERRFVTDRLGLGQKCVVFPFGLTDERLRAFRDDREPAAARRANRTVAFIGLWSLRKGSRDWPALIRRIRSEVPDARFLFLGTGYTEERVLADLGVARNDGVRVVVRYQSDELPGLLRGATVGAFPSYLEGFGFAVLETLASGLPTVAYDVPGPREMLSRIDAPLMVAPGDTAAFATRIVELLCSSDDAYASLAAVSTETAAGFSWPRIARDTLACYRRALHRTRQEER